MKKFNRNELIAASTPIAASLAAAWLKPGEVLSAETAGTIAMTATMIAVALSAAVTVGVQSGAGNGR